MRDWLIQLRKKLKLTQQQVADGAHIDRAYYAQIENGTRNPSMAVASQIATHMNINPMLFFSEHFNGPFEQALLNSPVIVAHCDTKLRYTWMFNPHPDFNMENIIGKTDEELDSNEGTQALMKLKQRVIDTGKTVKETIAFPLSNGMIQYFVFAQPIYNASGEIIGAATASTEIQS
ncbi:helix-turn-helix domain-containing protein [Halobacillus yeomjeoni]|uniref:Helix-turn-helix domain-containing protein n=1 Tax=Halobacillus yeomjeoni TaxID=311194 RepID=A0A931HWF4_9BACI|nr:helix-turn-helix domain-containing protein [Halobacillus yeomjeoni]MBH0230441.1 helix-turn-helix domain-containing protein [Halobacillus yeomjeoni]MCA0985327.1 helix-turn-helix domain-containing protein [Halobacillus yeomjeoni]